MPCGRYQEGYSQFHRRRMILLGVGVASVALSIMTVGKKKKKIVILFIQPIISAGAAGGLLETEHGFSLEKPRDKTRQGLVLSFLEP